MANEVVNTGREPLPDHLRGFQKVKIGNIDTSDLVIPRVKLLQALSPELQDFEAAKAGRFWHTIAGISMGDKLLGIPIIVKKSYILWSPRDDDRGILARAMDGIHWDVPGVEFTVKPKGSPSSITYKLGKTVQETDLDKFGSSIPGDPQSKPAASLTYNMLWYFPEWPDLSPSVIINTRSSVKPMQQLLSKIDSKPVAHFTQLYTLGIVQMKGAEGPYFNYSYTSSGYADKETCDRTQEMYDRFGTLQWRANEEDADVAEDSGNGRDSKPMPADEDIPF
jgi:hypothetical protein